jgi:hypothetical protein
MAAAPAPSPAPSTAPAPTRKGKGKKQSAALPEAVSSDPVVRLTVEQKIPGARFAPELEGHPQVQPLEDAAQEIVNTLGLAFYRANDQSAIMFNPDTISNAEVKAADEQGKLPEIFPEYGQLRGISDAGAPPQGGTITPPSAAGVQQPPQNIQNQTQKARLAKLTPQLPPGMSNIVGGLQQKAI